MQKNGFIRKKISPFSASLPSSESKDSDSHVSDSPSCSTTRLTDTIPQRTPKDSILTRLPLSSTRADWNLSHESVRKAPKQKLRETGAQQSENVEKVVHFFKTTVKFRTEHPTDEISCETLPNPESFERLFRREIQTCRMVTGIRLSSVSPFTLKRAASSAVLFFTYSKLSKFGTSVDNDDGDDEQFQKECIDKFKSLQHEEKADFLSSFVTWYEKIPPIRIISNKVLAAMYMNCRIESKESSTLATVVRGLLAFLTYVNAVEPSTCKSPTQESRTIWMAVRTTLDCLEKRKGGALDFHPMTMSLSDLVRMMENSTGVSTMFGLQSWMLAMTLAGFGLRIGSVRNQWDEGFWKEGFGDIDANFDSDEDDENYDKIEESKTNMSSRDMLTSDADSPSRIDLDVAFDSLKLKNVVVYRGCRQSEDPPQCVRMRVELSVSSTKTGGQQYFAPQIIGFSYPRILSNGEIDWSPNSAVAITILTILGGSTEAKKLVSPDQEPISNCEIKISSEDPIIGERPLFRAADNHGKLTSNRMRNVSAAMTLVADSLKLPASLFTSRSYRMGYAKGIVSSVVTNGDPTREFTVDMARETLFSSSRWKSNQADRYIVQVSKSLLRGGVTESGVTALDWQNAVYLSSAYSKLDYKFYDANQLRQHYVNTSEDKEEAEKEWDSMSKSEKRHALNLTNAHNYVQCNHKPVSPADLENVLNRRSVLNVVKTIELVDRIKDIDSLAQPFFGLARGQTTSPYRCPVLNCNRWEHRTVVESVEHWIKNHEQHKHHLQYTCFGCTTTSCTSSTHRNYLRHLNRQHSKSGEVFQWILQAPS